MKTPTEGVLRVVPNPQYNFECNRAWMPAVLVSGACRSNRNCSRVWGLGCCAIGLMLQTWLATHGARGLAGSTSSFGSAARFLGNFPLTPQGTSASIFLVYFHIEALLL